ncbi:MAG: hypothetical protein U0746_19885 [Gemmataceae bacterium]
MTTTSVRPRRRRTLLVLLGLLVAVPAAFVGTAVVRHHLAARRLAAVVAELDRTDPNWRLDDLERARAAVPDGENFALALDAAFVKLARPGQPMQSFSADDMHPTPNVRLTPEHETAARARLATYSDGLPAVLALADYPRGRHAVAYTADVVSTPLSHIGTMAHVNARSLDPAALLAVHDGDVPRALRLFRVRLNFARSLRDEPIFVTQGFRANYQVRAIRGLMALLGHATPTADQLAEARRELEIEAADDPWPAAARGVRAMDDRVMDAVRTGAVKPSYLKAMSIRSYRPTAQERVADWVNDRTGLDVLPAHTFLLELLPRGGATVKIPWPVRVAAVDALDAEWRTGPELAQWLATIDLAKRCRGMMAGQAMVRTGVAAVAVEEFRVRTGDWPKSLAALGIALPDDPYTGKPLLLKWLADGVAVYSVGPNGRDDGGTLMDYYPQRPEDYDIGVRLWDVPHRNQPPSESAP